eukprot:9967479-Alexandrium_andersonii.AAC.1
MSASLVGSEMCIRDRARTPRSPSEKGAAGERDGNEACRCPRSRPSGTPVSYTHLTLPTICSV